MTARDLLFSWPCRSRRRRGGWVGWGFLFAVLIGGAMPVRAALEDGEIVIVANANLAASEDVARHYAERRGVPEGNIILLPLPRGENLTRQEFTELLWEPLQDELVRRGLISGLIGDSRDEYGRRKVALSGHRIRYLVTIFGVPFRVQHDDKLPVPPDTPFARPPYKTTQACVDAELALLAWPTPPPLAGFVPNPLYRRAEPTSLDLGKVVRVSRLDGPTPELARALVDRALEVEAHGLWGRYYIDSGGPHQEGDDWLEAAAAQLAKTDLDGDWDKRKSTFAPLARFDAAAIYLGWYRGVTDGPFRQPGLQLEPGAIALHIHSFSAAHLAANSGWVGPLIAAGAGATWGNVAEPYLTFTHQPHLMLEALLAGGELGAASYRGLMGLGWMAMAIGDPLYRPFARSSADLRAAREQLPDDARRYLTLREIHARGLAGDAAGALALARELQQRDRRHPAVALTCARLLHDAGKKRDALRVLEFLDGYGPLPAEQWGVVAEAAEQLAAWDEPRRALDVWSSILNYKLEGSARMVALQAALPLAQATGQKSRAARIEELIAERTPKPKADETKGAGEKQGRRR